MKTQTPGPKYRIDVSCGDCVHVTSKRYAVQGDSGSDVECTEPSVGKRYIGDTTWDTPTWCPLRIDPVVTARADGDAAGFARGIEAAAKYAETHAHGSHRVRGAYTSAGEAYAKAIRALAQLPNRGETDD